MGLLASLLADAPLFSATAAIISFCVAATALFYTRRNNSCTHNHSSYSDLDKLYMDILKMGMENPKFRNPEYTCNYKWRFETEEERQRYECYAYMVWNICETVHDKGENDPNIALTWNPIVVAENKLHRVWFDSPENWHKFKEPYHEYVRKNLFEKPVPCPKWYQKIEKYLITGLDLGRTE